MSSWEIYLCNATGTRLAQLSQRCIVSLQASWAANAVAVVDIILAPLVPWSYIMPYGILDIYRTSDGGVRSRLFDTKFLIVDYPNALSGGAETYTLRGYGGNRIIESGIVNYAAGSAYASKTNQADDMIKAIAAENFGASVTDATRKSYNPPLAIQANATAAPSVSKDFSRQNCLSLFQELCNLSAGNASTPTLLYFDVVWSDVADSFELRTYVNQRGTDRSTGAALVQFSVAKRNLADPAIEYDYRNEANYITAGGQGTGDDRILSTQYDPARLGLSPYARREKWVDSRKTTADNIAGEALEALWANRPQRIVSGNVVNIPGCEYGTHWYHGDRVTQVSPRGDAYAALINAVSIDVSGGRENIGAALRSVT